MPELPELQVLVLELLPVLELRVLVLELRVQLVLLAWVRLLRVLRPPQYRPCRLR